MSTTLPDLQGTTPAPRNVSAVESVDFMKFLMLPLFGIVCIVGLLGNALIMYIMQFKIRQKSITDIYVTNLAVADFIFLFMLPFWAIEMGMNGRWIFGRVLCKSTSGSTYVYMYASVFFLAAMSVDRLFAVVFYGHSQKLRTRNGAVIGSVAIWVFSIIISSEAFYFRDLQHNNQTGISRCTWMFMDGNPSHRQWFIIHSFTRSIIGFALPFLIIAACYSAIIIFLKSRKTSGQLTSKRQDRVTTLVMVVILVFLICWLPNQISNALYALQGLEVINVPAVLSATHYYIHMFSTCLAWSHSCVNPILYAFMREDLKLKMTEVLHSLMCHCCGSVTADRFLKANKAPKGDSSKPRKGICPCWGKRKRTCDEGELFVNEVREAPENLLRKDSEKRDQASYNAPQIVGVETETTFHTNREQGNTYMTSVVR